MDNIKNGMHFQQIGQIKIFVEGQSAHEYPLGTTITNKLLFIYLFF